MKVFGKKLLICLLVFVLLFNFAFQPTVQASVSDTISGILDVVGGIADGIAGILTYPIKILVMIAESAILGLLGGIAATFGYVDEFGELQTGDAGFTFFTPDVIFFNKVLLTDANIFNLDLPGDEAKTILEMRTNIALWYYIMRIIAISILLAILIFIAIRMAISTIASDKAKYKEMLVHWASSIALVFILHYVIVIVCYLNSALVKILHTIYTAGGTESLENGIGTLLDNTLAISFTASWSSLIVVGMIIIQTLAFLVYYIKRMLTLSFLIIISPLITITYSIDKLGDGKAQALNTWMKEFFFTIIIQPFHCIIYMVFLSMAISALGITSEGLAEDVFGSGFGIGSLIGGILAILCIKFVWDAEKIVKNIFGIKVSESLGDAVASAAVAGAVVSKGMGMAKGAAKGTKNLMTLGNRTRAVRVGLQKSKIEDINNKLAKETDPNKRKKLEAEKVAAQNKIDDLNVSAINREKKAQARREKIQNIPVIGSAYNKGKAIHGAIGDFMGNKHWGRNLVAGSAAAAAGLLGGAMTYGASDKTSLFEAGLAGYAAYGGIKGGVLGLMNRKKDNYMDQTQSNAAVVCNATGKDPATMTSADVARMAMNATVKDSNGDFKNLKDDRSKAEEKIVAALQDKDRAQLKKDNPNLSDDQIEDTIAKTNYKPIAANVMQDIDNGIYFKNLDCDKIAANYNLDPSALRGAAGDYAEARALKNMATDNANLDAMAGQDGYHAAVLQAFAGTAINNESTTNTQTQNTQTSTESQTSTETETSTESQTSTENNNQTTQPQTISAEEIAEKLKEYLKTGNSDNINLDKLNSLLENMTPEEQAKAIEKADNFEAPYIMDNIAKTPEYFQDAMKEGKSVEVITKEICNEHHITEEKKIEKVKERVQEITRLYEIKNVIEEIRTTEAKPTQGN